MKRERRLLRVLFLKRVYNIRSRTSLCIKKVKGIKEFITSNYKVWVSMNRITANNIAMADVGGRVGGTTQVIKY